MRIWAHWREQQRLGAGGGDLADMGLNALTGALGGAVGGYVGGGKGAALGAAIGSGIPYFMSYAFP